MGQPFIVIGDTTSHGGTVIGCSGTTDTHGKGIARIGDMVSCPKKGCRGVFPIVTGDNSMIIDGAPAAYHGCKTACGATLISSQSVTTTEPSGGSGPGGNAALALAGDVGGGIAASYTDAASGRAVGAGVGAGGQSADDDAERFRGRFRLISRASGEPIAGKAVRVRTSSGEVIEGSTDDEGYTPWVERESDELLAFEIVEPAAP